MICFGKYKNKSYDYVLENDVKYCNWILTQSSNHKGMNEFKYFLQNNYKPNIPKREINCSELSTYYKFDNNFKKLINNLTINTNYINKTISNISTLPPDIYGVYIDYLIRYKINFSLNKEFHDNRYEHIIDTIDNQAPHLSYIIENSYDNMKHLIASYNDILNVSLCHMIFFGEDNAYNFVDYIKNNNINIADNLDLFLRNKLENKTIILCNPTLGNRDLLIGADADLIIDDELIDIKCSKYYIGENIEDYIQLFIYISLYFIKTGIKCKKITILNPILSYEKSINLNDWDHYDEIIDLLKMRIN